MIGADRRGRAAIRYLEVAERFQVEELADVDWRRAVPMVKRYRPAAAIRPPSLLGSVLHRAFGLTRYHWGDRYADDVRPGVGAVPGAGRLLRTAPSSGSMSSAELYVIGSVTGIPTGAYHFDPAAMALDPVRPDVTPGDLGLADDSLCLLITSVFGRLSFKYDEFGYRLQCLDAGVVAAQVATVLDDCGLNGQVHGCFDGVGAARLLGLDPMAERPLAVVTVVGLPPSGIVGDSDDTGSAPATPTPRTRPPRVLDDLPRTSGLCRASDVVHDVVEPGPAPLEVPETAETFGIPVVPIALASGWRTRRSMDGRFGTGSVGIDALAAVLGAGGGGWSGEVGAEHVLLYSIVLDVRGIDCGVYVYDRQAHTADRLRSADLRTDVWPHAPQNRVQGDHRASFFVFPVGDYAAGFAVYGSRWYQLQNIAAGISAQRTMLGAAAVGLGSRAMCSYDPGQVSTLLGLPTNLRPLCQIQVGPVDSSNGYTQPVSLRDCVAPDAGSH
ncbi:MAG: nitroreductase family protein [Pseudonocardia sp.]|nr:nitroreductase family protein [Pseudonocardia sp.]